MSPRAAWRLVALAFEDVYDYVPGKADWAAAGLPREGSAAAMPTAGDAARSDVPTCRLEDDLSDVRRRVAATDWDTCLVVNEAGVLLGRIGREALRDSGASAVEEAMAEGPGTVRPSAPLAPLLDRLRERNLTTVAVTRSDGTLVGAVRLEEADTDLR